MPVYSAKSDTQYAAPGPLPVPGPKLLYERFTRLLFGGRVIFYCLDESALYLEAGVVGMVQDAKFRVAALAVQVELAILLRSKFTPHSTSRLIPSGAPFTTCSTARRSLM